MVARPLAAQRQSSYGCELAGIPRRAGGICLVRLARQRAAGPARCAPPGAQAGELQHKRKMDEGAHSAERPGRDALQPAYVAHRHRRGGALGTTNRTIGRAWALFVGRRWLASVELTDAAPTPQALLRGCSTTAHIYGSHMPHVDGCRKGPRERIGLAWLGRGGETRAVERLEVKASQRRQTFIDSHTQWSTESKWQNAGSRHRCTLVLLEYIDTTHDCYSYTGGWNVEKGESLYSQPEPGAGTERLFVLPQSAPRLPTALLPLE